MSIESLNRTSDVIETPKVNIDVLKQRLMIERKKDRVRKTIFFSIVVVILSILTLLAY